MRDVLGISSRETIEETIQSDSATSLSSPGSRARTEQTTTASIINENQMNTRKTTEAEKHPLPKKSYDGKMTRSIAALSSASASTTAIAFSSIDDKSDGISSERNQRIINLPKTAPPVYQKISSTMIMEEEEQAVAEPCNKHKKISGDTYKAMNPSMILK